jgi:hypothetical protein
MLNEQGYRYLFSQADKEKRADCAVIWAFMRGIGESIQWI